MNSLISRLINYVTSLNSHSRRTILCVVDSLIIILSILITAWISPQKNFAEIEWIFLKILFISLPVYFLTGHYKGLTRYIASRSIYLLAVRNLIVFALVIFFYLITGKNIPNNAFLFSLYINQTIFIGTSRYIMRDLLIKFSNSIFKKVNVVIYGAGENAVQLAASLRYNSNYKILFFVDNRQNLNNRYIYDIPVKQSSY